MRPHAHTTALTALTLFAISMSSGCSATEPTEVVVGVTTQMQVPKDIRSVGILVNRAGENLFCNNYKVEDGSVRLPGTLGLQPDEGRVNEAIVVTILGFESFEQNFAEDCAFTPIANVGDPESDVRVVRRRRLSYDEDRIVYLPMPLRESCADVPCAGDNLRDVAEPAETCLAGKCEPADVDPWTLVTFSRPLVFGDTNTCFSTKACLAKQATAPATLIDRDTCTFALQLPADAPAPSPGSLNVRITYASQGTEVLDLDPVEGFTIPDPGRPLEFRLSSNLCQFVYAADRIDGVAASPVCPSKTPLQPICDGDLAEILEGDPLNIDRCIVPDALTATESALYVLMDRSASMGSFFGEEGLKRALETPLGNPLAARTRVAFKFLPASAGDCTGPSAYADPMAPSDVPFGFVDDVREAIAAKIGDLANVAATDPPLFLDAALRPEGVYQALRGLSPPASSSRFNRRAVLVIGNRDLWSRCAPGDGVPTPDQLAATALAGPDPLHTYVVLLPAPGSADQNGRDPVADAQVIAAAGGTELFDASEDEAEGAIALQSIVNDLGSCLYDAPTDTDLAVGSETIELSYFDPILLRQNSVPFNGACNESAIGQSGWNLEDGLVRICGQSCEELRDTLTTMAVVAAQADQVAENLPIRVAKPCGAP